MFKQKKFFRMLLCLALVAMFAASAACSLVPEDQVADAIPFTEKELQTNVIKIGDYTVTLEEYLSIYNEIAYYYNSMYGYDIASSDEELDNYKGMITDTLVEEHMMLYRASELGLDDLTEEQLAEIEADYQASVDEMYEYYTEEAETKKKTDDSIDVDAYIDEQIVAEAEMYLGEGTTIEEYKEYLHDSAHDTYVTNLLREYLAADIEVTDEDVTSYYNSSLDGTSTADKTYYMTYPGSYKNDQETFELTGMLPDGETTIPPLYVPEGYSRILHIYTAPNGELSEQYKQNEKKMTELTTEYGELALKDAVAGTKKNSSRMKEIVNEYKELEKQNKDERKEYFKDARTKIEEAYDLLKAEPEMTAEAFSNIMFTYTEDSYITGSETIGASGRLISKTHSAENDWSDEVKEAFAGMELGEYSAIIEDESGFHIIYYLSDVTSGEVPIDEVRDAIIETLKVKKAEETVDEKVAEWLEDEDGVIEINEDLIAEVGKRKTA